MSSANSSSAHNSDTSVRACRQLKTLSLLQASTLDVWQQLQEAVAKSEDSENILEEGQHNPESRSESKEVVPGWSAEVLRNGTYPLHGA